MRFQSLLLPTSILLWGCHHTSQGRLTTTSTVPSNANKPAPPKPAPPITEMTIERVPGMGNSPWYALTLHSDGTATYVGLVGSKLRGTHQTTFAPEEFVRLAQFVEDSGFVDFYPFYGTNADDIASVRVSIVRNKERTTIIDSGPIVFPQYEKEAPPALKEIQKRIDALVANAKWMQVSTSSKLHYYVPSMDQIYKRRNRN